MADGAGVRRPGVLTAAACAGGRVAAA
eukprot:COSAG03_NODE_10684_length_635_cov_70.091418_1_plen_26_part_10